MAVAEKNVVDTPQHGSDGAAAYINMVGHFFRATRIWASSTAFLLFVLLALAAFFLFWIDESASMGMPFLRRTSKSNPPIDEFPFNCINKGTNQTCIFELDKRSNEACPEYFRWMYEDLQPWTSTGITRDTLERAKDLAYFRLVIVNGEAYLEQYHRAYQTRDVFTIWGILQLLKLYPGKIPDLELMFWLDDRAVFKKHDYQGQNATSPPALFQYCGDDESLGIVFPDWSFWGWVEVNIKPWSQMLDAIIEGSNRTNWEDRVPYAYWKGNPRMGNRIDLMKCNVSPLRDWNARLYKQNWRKEFEEGFIHSQLEDQCTHRYKIYIEGRGWSVSEKYILACNSMTLLVKPQFYDFFTRGLVPLKHYWPISIENKCRDIKFAVNWGNTHPDKAQAIGKAGSKFIQENLKLEYVYDYMFHLLSEYAKLLKFKPEIPKGAVKLRAESMVEPEKGLMKEFMLESMVKSPKETSPCSMLPPYDPKTLEAIRRRKEQITRIAEEWERFLA